MIKQVTKFFQERRQQKDKDAFKSGFDYAAGVLLRKEETPISLDSYVNPAIDSTPFDKGVNFAVEKLLALKVISDNRV